MMTEENKPKVSIEVGAKAEFRAEVKGEIPSSSMGRLVDALTDVIRPFTERQGLKADQIRLQREEILTLIAVKARERLAIEGKEPSAVPNRILVPLLEKASLSDPEDTTLVEAWTNILASASSEPNQNHALFVDILSKLEAAHLKFLEFLAMPSGVPEDLFLHRSERDIREWVEEHAGPAVKRARVPNDPTGEIDRFGAEMEAYVRVPGSCLVAAGLAIDTMNPAEPTLYFELTDSYAKTEFSEAITGALESLNVVRRISISEPDASTLRPWLEVIQFTMFGYEFFYAAHSGRNIWAF
jgi:hypothetical protein